MRKLTILSGLPASGKSTYVDECRNKNYDFTLISFDATHQMLFGKYKFSEFGIVTNVANNIFDQAVFYGHNIMIDNTNLRSFYIRRWQELLGGYANDYEVKIISFKTSIKECLLRNMNRDRGNMNVPQHVILKMANSSDLDWLKEMWETERQDIMSNHEMYNLTLSDIERYK